MPLGERDLPLLRSSNPCRRGARPVLSAKYYELSLESYERGQLREHHWSLQYNPMRGNSLWISHERSRN